MSNEQEATILKEVTRGAIIVYDHAKLVATSIIDDRTYLDACELRKSIRKDKEEAVKRCEPIRKKAYDLYKAILADKDLAINPFDQALAVIDPAISKYHSEQQRLAKIEQDRLAKEHREREEKIRLDQAEKLEKAGKIEKASAILEKPIIVPKVEIPKPIQAKGVSFRESWSVNPEVDMKALLSGIVAGTVPLESIQPNMTFLNGQARLLKGNLAYPGVTPEMKKITSSRG